MSFNRDEYVARRLEQLDNNIYMLVECIDYLERVLHVDWRYVSAFGLVENELHSIANDLSTLARLLNPDGNVEDFCDMEGLR